MALRIHATEGTAPTVLSSSGRARAREHRLDIQRIRTHDDSAGETHTVALSSHLSSSNAVCHDTQRSTALVDDQYAVDEVVGTRLDDDHVSASVENARSTDRSTDLPLDSVPTIQRALHEEQFVGTATKAAHARAERAGRADSRDGPHIGAVPCHDEMIRSVSLTVIIA